MGVLVFRLNDAPGEEVQAIRELLESNNIEYYETSAGKWGFSVAGIWLKNRADQEQARRLIEEYQATYSEETRRKHEELRAAGQLDTVFSRFFRYPLQVIVYLLLVLLVIYLSIAPFMNY